MSAGARQVRVIYSGEVQGVGFRYTVQGIARGMGVTGGVENLPDGTVRLVAEGPEDVLKRLLLQVRVSRLAGYIQDEQIGWSEPEGRSGFYSR